MSELIPAGLLGELQALSSDELRRQLTLSLKITAEQLVRMAAIVRVLEERGDDLSEFRGALPGYLRKIAYGQMLAEVVVRFADSPQLIQRVSQLPIPDQRRLADGESIEMAVLTEAGTDKRMVDPLALRGPLLTQVFAPDHIRPLHEQVLILEARRAAPQPVKKQAKSRVRSDRELGGVFVGRGFASQEEILDALADLQPPQEAEDEGGIVPITVQVSSADHKRMKVRAAQAGCTMQDLFRKALAAAGLIKKSN